jgi:hypothetical protein
LQLIEGSESMGDHDSGLMIGGASVEDTLTLWASSLRDIKQRIRPLFTQERVAASAGQFLDGLLGGEPRKTVGCGRRRPAIQARGASRRSCAGGSGMPTRCAIL